MANPVKEFSQHLVLPAQIEGELDRMWETLAKENVQRASLFNLIVFHRLFHRTDYLRTIVQTVIDQFPCRTLFVSHDAESSQHYLKTAVSVIAQAGPGGVACDSIDIGVAGSEWERVPYVILPHIIPDLPVYLLWAEDPIEPHPLFHQLSKLSTRTIFDSECTRNLQQFAHVLLSMTRRQEIADLNWVRLEGWRDLLAALFESSDKLRTLKKSSHITLVYNSHETESFHHLDIQTLYLLCWLSSCLSLPLAKVRKNHFLWNKQGKVAISCTPQKEVHPGALLSLSIEGPHASHLKIIRDSHLPNLVTTHYSTEAHCELPNRFMFKKTAAEHSLSRELFFRGTSPFFLKTLQKMARL